MRLFAAIELSDEMKKALVRFQDSLKDAGVFGGYTKPDNLHLTLTFIGEYGDPDRILYSGSVVKTNFQSFLSESIYTSEGEEHPPLCG